MSQEKLDIKPPRRLTTTHWHPDFLRDIDVVIFDCDGVLWTGSRTLPGAAETLNELVRRGKRIFFCTNSSLKSRFDVCHKLEQMGVRVSPEIVYSTSSTTASYIAALPKSQFDPQSQMVLVVGSKGIMQELANRGIPYKNAEDYLPAKLEDAIDFVASDFKPDPRLGAVVVGIDHRITYPKAAYAATVLREIPNSLFISTNQDATYPAAHRKLPGAGSCLAILKTASGREPINMGKPSTQMMEAIIRDHNLEDLRRRGRILMVGDRLDTDVMFANATGVNSLLVFTGVTSYGSIAATYNIEAKSSASQAIESHRRQLSQLEEVKDAQPAASKARLETIQLPTFVGASIGVLIGLDSTGAASSTAPEIDRSSKL